jgi:hypothetical protein
MSNFMDKIGYAIVALICGLILTSVILSINTSIAENYNIKKVKTTTPKKVVEVINPNNEYGFIYTQKSEVLENAKYEYNAEQRNLRACQEAYPGLPDACHLNALGFQKAKNFLIQELYFESCIKSMSSDSSCYINMNSAMYYTPYGVSRTTKVEGQRSTTSK